MAKMSDTLLRMGRIIRGAYDSPPPDSETVKRNAEIYAAMADAEKKKRDKDPVAYDRMTEGMLPRILR